MAPYHRSYSKQQSQGPSAWKDLPPQAPPSGIDKYRLLASVCREKFSNFVRHFWHLVPGSGGHRLRWNWHMDLLCEELQLAAERVQAWLPAPFDVVVNQPPGTSKSLIVSVLFQPWVWTRMPEARFITATHTQNLVLGLADKSLQVMKSEQYTRCFPEVVLRRSAKGSFANTQGGDRLAATVGGQNPMGFHAHFGIGDDLLDPAKALSEVGLATARAFVENYLATRVVDKLVSMMFVVMQRVGVGDPTDVMIEISKREGARSLRHICLPCDDSWPLISPPEVKEKYRQGDGLLDPGRLNKIALAQARARGELYYATQYGQNPTLRGGGIFKVDYFNKRKKSAPYACRRVLYVDRASTADGGAATACVLMSRDSEGAYYVEHVMSGHWEPVERLSRIRALALRFRSRYGKYEPVIWVEKEAGAVDKDAWIMMVRALEGFTVRKHNVAVLGSKDIRAEPWSTQLAGGNVFLVDNGELEGTGRADWDINGYIQEHVNFRADPTKRGRRLGGKVDRVDASSGAMAVFVQGMRPMGLRTYGLGTNRRDRGLRIVACSKEELNYLDVEGRNTVLILIQDPGPPEALPPPAKGPIIVGVDSSPGAEIKVGPAGVADLATISDTKEAGDLLTSPLAEPGLTPMLANSHPHGKNLDTAQMYFADIDPKDYQDAWESRLPEYYHRTPAEVQLTREQGKALWGFLLKKRDPAFDVIVLADPGGGDRRAVSIAQAIADTLRLPRSVIYCPEDPEAAQDGDPSNCYIYDTIKGSRHLVRT